MLPAFRNATVPAERESLFSSSLTFDPRRGLLPFSPGLLATLWLAGGIDSRGDGRVSTNSGGGGGGGFSGVEV